MRIILVLAVLLGVVYMVMVDRSRDQRDEYMRREEAAEQIVQKRQEEFQAQRAESERRRATSYNCDTVIGNRQALYDVMTKGGTLHVFGSDKPAPKTPEEIRAAFDETQAYVEQNCADSVQARRTPGGHCSHPAYSQDLVCKQSIG